MAGNQSRRRFSTECKAEAVDCVGRTWSAARDLFARHRRGPVSLTIDSRHDHPIALNRLQRNFIEDRPKQV